MGKIAVVRQQKQALGILVEPADRHDAEFSVHLRHKFHDSLRLRIVGRGQITGWLMEHNKNRPAQAHRLSVHRDADHRFVKLPALVGHNRSVYRRAARTDDRAQFFSAGDARFTQNSVQSLHTAAPVINQIGLHRLYHAIK